MLGKQLEATYECACVAKTAPVYRMTEVLYHKTASDPLMVRLFPFPGFIACVRPMLLRVADEAADDLAPACQPGLISHASQFSLSFAFCL